MMGNAHAEPEDSSSSTAAALTQVEEDRFPTSSQSADRGVPSSPEIPAPVAGPPSTALMGVPAGRVLYSPRQFRSRSQPCMK